MKWGAAVVGICLVVSGGQAWAQTARPKKIHHPEIDLGAAWIGGASVGSGDANLTTPAGTSQPLFSVSNRMGAETALEVHLAFRLTARLRAEVTGTFGHADLQSHVTGDFEAAAPITASDRLTIVTIQGSGIWYFRRHGKIEPFVRAGAGWMRELTSGEALAGDGAVANAGAGVKYWWLERSHGVLKRFGLRSEARVVGRFGGLEFGTKTRLLAPAVSVTAIIGF